MVDILDEVQEDMRLERFLRAWNKGTKFYFWAAIAIILTTTAVVGYNYYKQSQQQKEGDRLYTAIQQAYDKAYDPKESLASFGSIVSQADSTTSLAELKQASLLVASGDVSKALSLYASIASNHSYRLEIRDLATIYRLSLMLDQNQTLSDQDQKKLKEIAGADRPYRYTAQEIQIAEALKNNNTKEERALLSRLLSDPDAPASIHQRAEDLYHSLFPGESLQTNSIEKPNVSKLQKKGSHE